MKNPLPVVVVLKGHSGSVAVQDPATGGWKIRQEFETRMAISLTDTASTESLVSSCIERANPYSIAGVVVLHETADARTPSFAITYPVPVLIVPEWMALSALKSSEPGIFGVLDGRECGSFQVVCQTGRDNFQPIFCKKLPSASDDFLLRCMAEGEQSDKLIHTILAELEGALRWVDLTTLICTGEFFETFAEVLSDLMRTQFQKLEKPPDVVIADRESLLAGACNVMTRTLQTPGVWAVRSSASARLEVISDRRIRYSTVHPDGYVFDPKNTAIQEALAGRSVMVVTDRDVHALYGSDLRRYLDASVDCRAWVTVESSEDAKTWPQVQRISYEAIRSRLPRDGVILGVGGGVTLDLAGFAASIFRRGINYVRVPTSLIGMIDVGVGIKHAINFQGRKNIIGAFYPATTNINDPTFLLTLPQRHLSSGIAEIVKMAFVRDEHLFRLLESQVSALIETRFQKPAAAHEILLRAEYLMMQELQNNLFETQLNRLPDFGHSFSPAIETASGHEVNHGEAVAIDMLLSTALGVVKGMCGREVMDRLGNVLSAANLPLYHELCTVPFLAQSLADTRAHRAGNLNLVVPTGVGTAIFIQEVSAEELEVARNYVKEKHESDGRTDSGHWRDASAVRRFA